ncbi:MAG: AAA family ATPase [Chromatiaceae bacterium]|jgi:MSHA biogenesis protein MshM|nr:AAA family ATPase [Chromatiaceae bacterium]
MYLEFFNLSEAPFSLTPDTAFYYSNPSHQEALNTLLVALQMGEGFIKVTGEVGTGKTLLCRKLLRELAADGRFVTAYIPNPALTATALRFALADELGIRYHRNLGQQRVMQLIAERLVEEKAAGRGVVLIVDEAQALPEDCLEAVRLLTNLETEKSKLLQVVLFGQPELDEHLARPSARQLRQRITFTYTLTPMDSGAVSGYLMHRMGVAGYRGPRLFPAPIARRIARSCHGIPRLVNIVAHKCLLAAYGEGRAAITRRHLERAIADTESLHGAGARFSLKRVAMALAGACSAGAAALGVYILAGPGL